MVTLTGHAAGNGGYGQGDTYGRDRTSPTRSYPCHNSRLKLTTLRRTARMAQSVVHSAPPSAYALPANSRVSVWTLTFSPSLMNRGTRISSPVSSVASLVTLPLAVSPRVPGSVYVTVSSTWGGNCRPMGLPLNFW